MKKFLFVVISCLCLCLCGCSQNENQKLLIGEWSYLKTEIGETNYTYFVFNNDNSFKYSICYHYKTDNDCNQGKAEFYGTYSLNDNHIELNIQSEKQIINRHGFSLAKPSTSYIIDFKNMYFCNEQDGLNCKQKFEKDA